LIEKNKVDGISIRLSDILDPNPILKCCGGQGVQPVLTEEEKLAIAKALEEYDPVEAIRENKNWNIAANVMAVICVVTCVFLHAFFA
jgi:hypothetical protein